MSEDPELEEPELEPVSEEPEFDPDEPEPEPEQCEDPECDEQGSDFGAELVFFGFSAVVGAPAARLVGAGGGAGRGAATGTATGAGAATAAGAGSLDAARRGAITATPPPTRAATRAAAATGTSHDTRRRGVVDRGGAGSETAACGVVAGVPGSPRTPVAARASDGVVAHQAAAPSTTTDFGSSKLAGELAEALGVQAGHQRRPARPADQEDRRQLGGLDVAAFDGRGELVDGVAQRARHEGLELGPGDAEVRPGRGYVHGVGLLAGQRLLGPAHPAQLVAGLPRRSAGSSGALPGVRLLSARRPPTCA